MVKQITLSILYLFISYCFSQTIGLDTTFGHQGKIVCWDNFNENKSADVRILPSGKILVSTIDTKTSLLKCFNSDGTIDETFGNNGVTSIRLKQKKGYNSVIETHEIKSIVTTPEGKIIVGGFEGDSIVLFGFNSNGIPDSEFGVNGVVKIPSQVKKALPKMNLSLLQNKILVSDNGFTLNLDTTSVRYKKWNRPEVSYEGVVTIRSIDFTGKIDADFGEKGKIETTIASTSFSIRIESDTTFLLSAIKNSRVVGEKKEVCVSRYSSSGINIKQFHFFNAERYEPILISDENFLIFGSNYKNQFYLKQYSIDGTIDSSFGKKGKALIQIDESTSSFPSSILIKSINSNEILLAITPLIFSSHEICLMKFYKDGQLLSGFGNNGRILTPISKGNGVGFDKNTLTPKILGLSEVVNGQVFIIAKEPNFSKKTSELVLLKYIL